METGEAIITLILGVILHLIQITQSHIQLVMTIRSAAVDKKKKQERAKKYLDLRREKVSIYDTYSSLHIARYEYIEGENGDFTRLLG